MHWLAFSISGTWWVFTSIFGYQLKTAKFFRFDTILGIRHVCMSTNPRCRRGLLCHWTRANAEWGRMAQNGATNTQSSGWVLSQFLLICGWAKVVKDDFVALIISWFGWYFARLQNLMTGMSWPMRLPTDGQPEIKFSWNFRWQTIAMRTPTHVHRSLVCILRSDCIHVCLMMFIAINIYLISKSDKARKDNPWCGSSSQSLSQCARTEGSKRGSLLPTTH